MAKLVAIGDSITQGFQSGAIKKTDLSYPVMIARSLGLSIPTDFPLPSFPESGLPLNLEELLIFMQDSLGREIDTGEWFFRFPFLLSRFMDQVEDLYERGTGKYDQPSAFRGTYHNLAVWGFRVFDSFTVDSEYCQQQIKKSEGRIEDDFLGLPSAPMYRTAYKVLNPANKKKRANWTQMRNLEEINDKEGVENLIIWFGANDCLGTVVNLKLKQMPEDFSGDDPEERRQFNLTHPKIFAQDFERLIKEVKKAISENTRVFVGNVPYVTIPPITKGIGELAANSKYFDKYGRFFADEDNFNPFFNSYLKGEEVKHIDETIDTFNEIIKQQVSEAGQNWHLVDLSSILNSLAVKRNHLLNSPEEPLKQYYASLGINDHPLLRLDPIPSVLKLDSRDHKRIGGGLFSLDFVHPTTISYGIVAEAFLREMKKVGVPNADPLHLNWNEIILQDSLIQAPPVLWDDIVSAAERNVTLWDLIFRIFN
jgi:hypothetical protein